MPLSLMICLGWNTADRTPHLMEYSDWEYEVAYRLVLAFGKKRWAKFVTAGPDGCADQNIKETWYDLDSDDTNAMTEKQWELAGDVHVSFCEITSDAETNAVAARVQLTGIRDHEAMDYIAGTWLGAFHAGTWPDEISIKVER